MSHDGQYYETEANIRQRWAERANMCLGRTPHDDIPKCRRRIHVGIEMADEGYKTCAKLFRDMDLQGARLNGWRGLNVSVRLTQVKESFPRNCFGPVYIRPIQEET